MEQMLIHILDRSVDGIVMGSIFALAGIGLTMLWGIIGICNFAHGDFLTVGAIITLVAMVNLDLPIFAGAMISVGFLALVGVFLEKSIFRPMRKRGAGATTQFIIAIGIALVLRNSVLFACGPLIVKFPLPIHVGYTIISDVTITIYEIAIIAIAVSSIILVHLFLKYTKIGKAMRALSDDIDLAEISGIDVDRTIIWIWIIACTLAAMAGVLLGLETSLTVDMGWLILLPVFASVILGGIGSPYGAIVGAMVIGLSTEISTVAVPVMYKYAVAFVIMIFIIFLEPRGIVEAIRR